MISPGRFAARKRLVGKGWNVCKALSVMGALVGVGAPRAGAVTQAEEIKLGSEMAREAPAMFGGVMPASSPLSQRVARIGRRFAKLSTRKGIPFSYQVLDNKKILNAFAVPGGHIFITRRLVEFARNDAELAAVLGHETGHIEHRDTAQRIEGMKRAQHNAAVLSQRLLGKVYAQNSSGFFQVTSTIGYALLSLSYGREQESQADEAGARWMARLGYDPHAIVTLFEHMEQANHATASRSFFATHPPAALREERLSDLIEREHLMDVAQAAGGPRLWDTPPAKTAAKLPAKPSTPAATAPPQAALEAQATPAVKTMPAPASARQPAKPEAGY